MREYGFHRVDAADIHAGIVITTPLPLREMKPMAGIEIASPSAAKMNRRGQMLDRKSVV